MGQTGAGNAAGRSPALFLSAAGAVPCCIASIPPNGIEVLPAFPVTTAFSSFDAGDESQWLDPGMIKTRNKYESTSVSESRCCLTKTAETKEGRDDA